MQHNICLIVLVGIPAAGKSTFCKNFLVKHQHYDVKVISYDDLCVDYTSQSRQTVFENVELLIQNCLHKTNQPVIILIDDNMYYRSMRKQYEHLARKYEISFFKIFFQVQLNEAIKHNLARTNAVPETIIREMFEKMEVPQDNVFVIQYSDCDINALNNNIEYALRNPLKPRPMKKIVHSHASKLNTIDLLLRELVAVKVASTKQSAKYVLIKQVVYKHIRAGCIVVNGLEGVELYEFLKSFFMV